MGWRKRKRKASRKLPQSSQALRTSGAEFIEGQFGSYLKFPQGRGDEVNPLKEHSALLLPPKDDVLDFDTPILRRRLKEMEEKAHQFQMENIKLRTENILLRDTIEDVRADAKHLHGCS